MTTFPTDIEFTFIEPPTPLNVDSEDESTFPVIKVDASKSDMAIQALLLRILPLLDFQSQEFGADYVFEEKE